MRKRFVLLLIGLLLLLITFGQTTLRTLGVRRAETTGAGVSVQIDAPINQPPGGFLTGPNPGDPLEIALNYLRQHGNSLGLSSADLADIIVTDRYVTQHNGVTHLYLHQRYHGIEIFNGIINLNISRNGEVISLGNRFVGDLAHAINTDTATLSATTAVEYVAQQLNLRSAAPIYVIEDRQGQARELQISAAGISRNAIPAKLLYQRQAAGKLRLAWGLMIEPPAQQHKWHLRVDAVNGAILAKDDLILHDSWTPTGRTTTQQEQPPLTTGETAAKQPASPLAPPTYQVFALPLEDPNDGVGLPNSQTIVNNSADPLASPYGWHDIDARPGHEFLDTRGNNVSVQEDRNDDNADGFRPTGRKPKKFNFTYPYEPTLEPTAGDNTAAAIVNLFYWNNILHDLTYRYGFDEASGNFQENNYGRGGLGADAVPADVQDGFDWGARNNAFFMITPDGVPPRLGMFVFDYTTPNRDSALDNGIIIHEYAHGISTRLVGGPSAPYCLNNAEQMGEGWSDWFTLALTTQSGDTGNQGRGLGTYVLGQPRDGNGIRRYRYSTDMTIDPFTYGDMSTSGGDIYQIGQIWASMLWDLQWNLIEQKGFDANFYTGGGGNNLALQLVMDGLKLTPCDPGFVDARDAILLADQVNNAGANQCTIWQSFAKRGLGLHAQQGNIYDPFDGVAAFDLPIVCRNDLSLTKIGTPDPVEAGQVLTYLLVASNYTEQPLTGVRLRDPIPAHTTYVADSASDGGSAAEGIVTWQLPTLNLDESVTRTFQVQVDRSYPDPVVFFFDDLENGGGNWTTTGLWHLQADAEPCGNSFSPTHSWYYGQGPDCLYTDTENGELTTINPLDLPSGRVTLDFMSWEAYEDCCDWLEALVSTDGVNFTNIWNASDNDEQWHAVTVDLSAYAGQRIWLRFAFQADDSVVFTGWYLDDVRLTVAADVVNHATVTSNEGVSTTTTSHNQVIKTPEIVVAPTAFTETLKVGTKVVRSLTITNVGTMPLDFRVIQVKAATQAPTVTTMLAAPMAPLVVTDAGVRYAGDRQTTHRTPATAPKAGGLTGTTTPNVLLLAAADVLQLQALLAAYPDLGEVDIYDARLDTPTLDELTAYETVIVISNSTFASPSAMGDLLADYVDDGGTVIQTVATFYDSDNYGWGLQGRWVSEGYSPLIGSGDWFTEATLGSFDATHPIMQGVTTASDYYRQVMALAPGAELVASWTDDEFVATKAQVVALNTFLSDDPAWTGDVDLIVHNSIIWLQTQSKVAWLAVEPVTGTVAVDGAQTIALTIDAGVPEVYPDDYRAILRVRSNDRDEPRIDIPVTLHAIGPELRIGQMQSYFGRPVQLPVNFRGNDLAIAATAFAVDYDEQCLHFDPTDANGNGIPDAIKLTTPPGFELIARTNISDVNSELALFVGDLTPPLTALPDGTLMTIDFTARCQPQATALTARVGFGATPPASFGDLNGVARNGRLIEGAAEIQLGLPGDCNQDGVVSAADGISCVLEIFDGDGTFWLDAPGGTFAGSPQGCDANLDQQIDAGDLLCTVLTIFQGQGACTRGNGMANSAAETPAILSIPDGISAGADGQVSVPVSFTANGNPSAAAVFALTFDPAQLRLDPTDSDGNGIPDAISFSLPEGMVTSVMVVDQQRIQIAIADLSLPFVTLPDGPLATITFTVQTPPTGRVATSPITFAGDLPASVGTHRGQSAAVTTDDGSVHFGLGRAAEGLTDKTFLPWVER